MSVYGGFAHWYDALNHQANYATLCNHIVDTLQTSGITGGLVADLGCGTGEVSLELQRQGYDMIAVDASADMLAVLQNKLLQAGRAGEMLLLQQDLAKLDLYGTVGAAISTFDVFNHLPKQKLLQALQRVALFLDDGGLLLFDANTPYKHEQVLAQNEWTLTAPDALCCHWQNRYNAEAQCVRITLQGSQNNRVLFEESFVEYSYSLDFWRQVLTKCGFALLSAIDGESFSPLAATSSRYFIVAQKQAARL